jgi:hypothetical protein
MRGEEVMGYFTADPLGFEAGDANLHRYVGNDPTDATDPTGNYLVANNANSARQLTKELNAANVKGITTTVLASGQVYIQIPITNENQTALYGYANSKWKAVFAGLKAGETVPAKSAAERNAFLFAVGLAGEGLAASTGVVFSGGTGYASGNLSNADIKAIKQVRGKTASTAGLPLAVDIGGGWTVHSSYICKAHTATGR